MFPIRPKTYPYLIDDGREHKKAEGTKKCVIKRKLMFQNYKDCLLNNKNVYRPQERLKSYNHDVYTEEVIMMIKEYKHTMGLQHTHMEQMLLKCAKVKC